MMVQDFRGNYKTVVEITLSIDPKPSVDDGEFLATFFAIDNDEVHWTTTLEGRRWFHSEIARQEFLHRCFAAGLVLDK